MTYHTILWLGVNYEAYSFAYYQKDLQSTVESQYSVCQYGPGFGNHDESDTIHDILEKVSAHPDLVVVANTWENQDLDESHFSPHPGLKLDEIDIPTLMFLNKEYAKLDQKLDFIRENNIDYVTTVLKDRCREWEDETGATFIWKPFGIDLDRFAHDPSAPSSYDFGFTGNLHEQWLDERKRIKDHVFRPKYVDFSWWHNLVHTRRFEERYDALTIYWGEWENRNLWFKSRAPFGDAYVALLNECKTFLNTLSAIGIFNPRFWELMATKTLIICPEDEYYGLLSDGDNCVMYSDLDEFDELLHYYATNETERQEIVDRAYETVQQYEWTTLVQELMSQIQ